MNPAIEVQAELPAMPSGPTATDEDAALVALAKDIIDRVQRLDMPDEDRATVIRGLQEELGKALTDPNYS
jgi:hypothetical protein